MIEEFKKLPKEVRIAIAAAFVFGIVTALLLSL